MTDRQVLQQLVQISDLHVGEVDPGGTGNAAIHPVWASTFISFPYLDGLLGHQGQSLRDLVSFFRSLNTPAGLTPRLMVTGDFTRCGSAAELGLAYHYVAARINLSKPTTPVMVGLDRAGLPDAIPGNHDHWGGVNVPTTGWSSVYYGAPFAQPLPRRIDTPLAGGRKLVVLQIDSDADVYPLGLTRSLAWGAFRSQLSRLAPKIGPPNANEVRVLMVHHSISKRGLFLRMTRRSRNALERFVMDHDIKVILSGHTHTNKVTALRAPDGTEYAKEFCCGSTAQLDHLPQGWATLLGAVPSPNWPANTLFVHELVEAGDGLWWEASPWARDISNNGFHALGIVDRIKVA